MGLDDMLKGQIRERAPELKQRLVAEFDELTHEDMDEAGDDSGQDHRQGAAEDRAAARTG